MQKNNVQKSKFVGITIPGELYDKLEKERDDLPRSYFYKKLVQEGYKNRNLK